MLAFRSKAEGRWLYSRKKRFRQFTPNTITDRRRLLEHLSKVQRAGVAVDREELVLGLRCLAAPVLDFTGSAVAAMRILAPAVTLDEERVAGLRALLMEAVAVVAKALGGPADPRRTGK